jgi:hypothetical protein
MEIVTEAVMPDPDRKRQDIGNDTSETRLQVDPMLRSASVPWGWALAVVIALVVVAGVLFATNRDEPDVSEAPAAEAPVATGAAPTAPERSTNGAAQQ